MLTDWTIRFIFDGTPDDHNFIRLDDLRFSRQREENEVFSRLSLETELKIVRVEYEQFKNKITANPCEKTEVVFTYQGTDVFTGKLNLQSGVWQDDVCILSIPIDSTDDQYACLFSSWEEEFNIIDPGIGGPAISSNAILGVIEECFVEINPLLNNNQGPDNHDEDPFECDYAGVPYAQYVNQCLEGPLHTSCLGFTLVAHETEQGSGNRYRYKETYKRERLSNIANAITPPGNWIFLEDNGDGTSDWVRGLITEFDTVNSTGNEGEPKNWFWRAVGVDVEIKADNGRLLNTILTNTLNQYCGLSIVSDFLNINPDSTAPSNAAYDFAVFALQELIVYQITDIKVILVESSEAATRGILTLQELFTLLRESFQVYFKITGTTIRIEHITYFTQTVGEDLTVSRPEFLEGRNQFTFNNAQQPPSETFQSLDNSNDGDFMAAPIEYPNCSSSLSAVVTHNVGKFAFDITEILDNPDTYPNAGFVLVSGIFYDGQYRLLQDDGFNSGVPQTNAILGWPYLHDNLWKDYRYQITGTMNRVADTAFNSKRKTRVNEQIYVPRNPLDYFNYDSSTLVTTFQGNGEQIADAWEAKSCLHSLTLQYD